MPHPLSRTCPPRLYAQDWKACFAKEGDPRHGTADDPRIVLLGVTVHSAVFFESTEPQPVVLFELAKAWLTGKQLDVGTMHASAADGRQRTRDAADPRLRP